MNFLHRVQGVVILDEMGGRVFAKYYVGEDTPETSRALASLEKQHNLELAIHQVVRDPKRSSQFSVEGDIMIIESHAVLYNVWDDVVLLVIGDSEENELVLFKILRTITDALKMELQASNLNMRMLLESYDALLLTIDEILDEGIVLETNSTSVTAEVDPFISDTGGEAARKALSTVNKYLRENL